MAEQEVKKRRITSKDFDRIEEFVDDEFDTRKDSNFRKDAERKWLEVDRQVEMRPMQRLGVNGQVLKGDWHNVIELGELAKASEIITADVMRISFANDNWFEPHVQLDGGLDPKSGRYQVNEEDQEKADGLLRALMLQQHKDFGFKARFKLSVKEALHHGSFVAEVRWETMMLNDGAKVLSLGAPVWQPYSMWNAYPDPSPSVIGTNLFYSGSMILVEYMPLHKLKRLKSSGWMPARIAKVKKETHKDGDNETEDVKLVKYIGDITLERQDGDIYLPNMKVVLANGTIVYAEPNELSYPSVIFTGYERQDVRDPYYTSPIIKQSPMQKFTTVMANKFADGVDLRTEPPVEYDANDPDYVLNGGPVLSPGSKNPTKSMGKGFKTLEIGDPAAALEAMQFGFRQMQEGLGVSSLRQGVNTSDRQTATEAKIMEAGSEVRTTDFIDALGNQALRPFCYLQHALNKKKFTNYEAYSNEMGTPDLIMFTKKMVDVSAHFDVVGSKGILGEQQKREQQTNLVLSLAQSQVFAPLIAKKADRIALDLFRDAGKKNPEEWVPTKQDGQIPPEVQAQMQQMQQMIQQLQGELQKAKAGVDADMAQIQLDREKAQVELQIKQAELDIKRRQATDERLKDRQDIMLEVEKMGKELSLERQRIESEAGLRLQEIRADFQAKVLQIEANHEAKKKELELKVEQMKTQKRTAKIRRTAEGYEVEA